MSLFQRKPQVGDSQPLYTLGSEKSLLVVGLGNPGKKYNGTRHNIGFDVVDLFAEQNDFPAWSVKKDLKAELASHTIAGTRVVLVKPTTYMNNSGAAIQAVQRFYKLPNASTLVIYDELAIPFGQIRTRVGGSDAGHNGVKSLIQHIGDDFGRLRVGVGSEVAAKADAANYVLGKFTKVEQADLPQIRREATALITEYIASGRLPADTRSIL